MGLFEKKQPLALQGFRTRRDAFEAMLQHLINDKSVDPMDAAKKADEFASIFAKNMGLPEKIEPERKGMDMILYNVKQTTTWMKENPEVVEIAKPVLLGAFTAIAGAFTGAKIAENNNAEQNQNREQIDFTHISTDYSQIDNTDNSQSNNTQHGTEKLATDNDNGGLPTAGTTASCSTDSERAI